MKERSLFIILLKNPERKAATPAEERSDETPQELATRRLSASSAESVRLERRIPYKIRLNEILLFWSCKYSLVYRLIVIVILFLFFLFPAQSLALSCAEPSSPDRAYGEYDAVIIGTVEKIKDRHSVKILTIRVDKSFKGVDENMISVKEDITWGESQLDANYLYYLNAEGGKWIHPLCAPTTDNTDLADEVFADKKEIALRDGNIAVNDTRDGEGTILLEMMVVILAASRLKLKKSRKII